MFKKLLIFILTLSLGFSVFANFYLGFSLMDELLKPQIPDYNYGIARQLEKNGSRFLDFKRINNSEWDRVCFLGPYSLPGRKAKGKVLGLGWDFPELESVLRSDGHNVIVFTSKNEVIDYYVHSRAKGDFS